jgi:hypothetical protein
MPDEKFDSLAINPENITANSVIEKLATAYLFLAFLPMASDIQTLRGCS